MARGRSLGSALLSSLRVQKAEVASGSRGQTACGLSGPGREQLPPRGRRGVRLPAPVILPVQTWLGPHLRMDVRRANGISLAPCARIRDVRKVVV